MIKIVVNGVAQEMPASLSLTELLAHLGLEGVPLVIEHNRTALLKSEWPQIRIETADEVEFVRVVAGG